MPELPVRYLHVPADGCPLWRRASVARVDLRSGDEGTMKTAAQVVSLFALAALGFHWLTAGSNEIVEGPSKTPDISVYQPSETK
jgi:hypothetical protein